MLSWFFFFFIQKLLAISIWLIFLSLPAWFFMISCFGISVLLLPWSFSYGSRSKCGFDQFQSQLIAQAREGSRKLTNRIYLTHNLMINLLVNSLMIHIYHSLILPQQGRHRKNQRMLHYLSKQQLQLAILIFHSAVSGGERDRDKECMLTRTIDVQRSNPQWLNGITSKGHQFTDSINLCSNSNTKYKIKSLNENRSQ